MLYNYAVTYLIIFKLLRSVASQRKVVFCQILDLFAIRHLSKVIVWSTKIGLVPVPDLLLVTGQY